MRKMEILRNAAKKFKTEEEINFNLENFFYKGDVDYPGYTIIAKLVEDELIPIGVSLQHLYDYEGDVWTYDEDFYIPFPRIYKTLGIKTPYNEILKELTNNSTTKLSDIKHCSISSFGIF